MGGRVGVVFWSATVVAVVLLGVVWTLADRVGAGSVEEDVLLALAGVGLAAAWLVAGRIVFVVGRLRRRGRGDTKR